MTTRAAALILPLPTALVFAQMLGAVALPLPVTLVTQLLVLFFAGVLAHGRLAEERPAPERLTEFYFLLSLGGVLGGALNALVAPLVFDSVVEYPLALVLALALRPGGRRRILDIVPVLAVFVGCVAGLLAVQSDLRRACRSRRHCGGLSCDRMAAALVVSRSRSPVWRCSLRRARRVCIPSGRSSGCCA